MTSKMSQNKRKLINRKCSRNRRCTEDLNKFIRALHHMGNMGRLTNPSLLPDEWKSTI